jgi:hypothetical protein
MMLSHLRGKLLIIWIPAFAGMTQFYANELSGLNSKFVTRITETERRAGIDDCRQLNAGRIDIV